MRFIHLSDSWEPPESETIYLRNIYVSLRDELPTIGDPVTAFYKNSLFKFAGEVSDLDTRNKMYSAKLRNSLLSNVDA